MVTESYPSPSACRRDIITVLVTVGFSPQSFLNEMTLQPWIPPNLPVFRIGKACADAADTTGALHCC